MLAPKKWDFACFFMHGRTRIGVICASRMTSTSVPNSFRCAIAKSFREMSYATITFLPIASGELFHPPISFTVMPSMMQYRSTTTFSSKYDSSIRFDGKYAVNLYANDMHGTQNDTISARARVAMHRKIVEYAFLPRKTRGQNSWNHCANLAPAAMRRLTT